tara:strand:+ start:1550 stop:2074 length:525 start_codon:yes stop_codon:yes gene_type:complete
MKLTRTKLRSLILETLLGESISSSKVESSIDRAIEILEIGDSNFRPFMLEIVRTESGFNPSGESGFTSHRDNPFQLTRPAIDQTKISIRLVNHRDRISKNANMQNPWADQPIDEIKSNTTLGALAAALYILDFLRDSPVPSDLQSRAALWKKKYNTESGDGEVSHYISKNQGRF